MTIGDIVSAALRKLQVIPPGQSPSASEMQSGIDAANVMFANWNGAIQKAIQGTYLASIVTFNPLPAAYAVSTDAFTADASFQRPAIYNLAIELAGEFGRPVPPDVMAIAMQSKQAIITLQAPPI